MWAIKDYTDEKKGYIRVCEGESTVCDIFPFAGIGGVGRQRALENARKMVHAEQMQEALQQLLDYVTDGCPEGSYIAVVEAKAALSNIRAISDGDRHG